jgi:hypothetical protein
MGRTGRTVIVGDVHGCRYELDVLLARVQFSAGEDRLVLVGDLVIRGPDPHGVLATVDRLGAVAVRGNHENKLLAIRAGASGSGSGSGEHGQLAADLSAREWAILEAMPLWLDLPEHGARVVHAGVVPGQEVQKTAPEALFTMRAVDASGRWNAEKSARPLWGSLYEGPPHVIFGHNALEEPQLHPWATGIDTACVYGGCLSAVVLQASEAMPHGERARERLVSVAARRAYSEPKGGLPR